MNQEIIDKLHTALYQVSPLTEDRERLIAEMGEVIWIESLEKIISALPELAQKEVATCIENQDLDRVVEICLENDIDLDAIVGEVSTSVMDDVLKGAQ
jgi:hypothetical protein